MLGGLTREPGFIGDQGNVTNPGDLIAVSLPKGRASGLWIGTSSPSLAVSRIQQSGYGIKMCLGVKLIR